MTDTRKQTLRGNQNASKGGISTQARVNVHLGDDLKARAEEAATESGVRLSEYVRQAVAEKLDRCACVAEPRQPEPIQR